MKRSVLLLCIFLISPAILPSLSWAFSDKVISIADGDTITVLRDNEQVRIRLYGIDTPERGQAFSKKAKQFTSNMVFGKVVEVDHIDMDTYGRIVALVRVDTVRVNSTAVQQYLVWIYNYNYNLPFCKEWFALQLRAKDIKRGFGLIPITLRLVSLGAKEKMKKWPVIVALVTPKSIALKNTSFVQDSSESCVEHKGLDGPAFS